MSERPRWVIVLLIAALTLVGVSGIFLATARPWSSGRSSERSAAVGASLRLPATTLATPSAPLRSTTAAPTSTKRPSVTSQPTRAPTVHRNSPAAKVVASTTRPHPATTTRGTSSAGRIRYGVTYTGIGTFYPATGAGNCLFPASSDLMVGAMNEQDYENSQACGAYLAVTGPNGATIAIKVVDRCPECPPGAIDLSKEAFVKLAPASTGRITIRWRLLSPALSGPVAYKYKSGSSQWWCAIQVLNHRNPIRSLEVRVGDSWHSLPRQNYNYFLSGTGSGCGAAIRITDLYGNQVSDTGIRISPDTVQQGHAQLPGA